MRGQGTGDNGIIVRVAGDTLAQSSRLHEPRRMARGAEGRPERAGHEPQAKALDQFAQDAKTVKLLDPTSTEAPGEMSGHWKIAVNTPVRRDS